MILNRLFNIGKTSRIRMFNTMQMGCNRRWYGGEKKEEHSKIEEHPFTDGEAKPFGMEKTDPVDWNRRMYIIFYLGGIALFTFLYQYVPDTSYPYLNCNW